MKDRTDEEIWEKIFELWPEAEREGGYGSHCSEIKAFWFVWNVHGGAPRFQHQSESSAIIEAERLARMNPGQTFVVLQSVCARVVTDMQRIDLRPKTDEICF